MLVLLFLAAVAAFALSAVSGGGASLLLVPLLGRSLDVASVPAALSLGTGVSSLSRVATFRKHIRWDVSAYFVPAAVPAALLGAALLRYLNPAYVQVLMALFLLASLRRLIRPGTQPEGSPESAWAVAGIGACAGFLSGLTGAVGVLFNRFYLSQGLTKQEIVATRATNEVLVHLAKLAVYARLGLMTPDARASGAVLAVAATLSAVLLKPLLARLPHAAFAGVGYAAMGVSGLAMLGSATTRVIEQDRIVFEARPIVHGVDAKLQWRASSLALEFEFDEGLEVELGTPLESLPVAVRRTVAASAPEAADVSVETVYTLHGVSYEAYYLKEGTLLDKREFASDGSPLGHTED